MEEKANKIYLQILYKRVLDKNKITTNDFLFMNMYKQNLLSIKNILEPNVQKLIYLDIIKNLKSQNNDFDFQKEIIKNKIVSKNHEISYDDFNKIKHINYYDYYVNITDQKICDNIKNIKLLSFNSFDERLYTNIRNVKYKDEIFEDIKYIFRPTESKTETIFILNNASIIYCIEDEIHKFMCDNGKVYLPYKIFYQRFYAYVKWLDMNKIIIEITEKYYSDFIKSCDDVLNISFNKKYLSLDFFEKFNNIKYIEYNNIVINNVKKISNKVYVSRNGPITSLNIMTKNNEMWLLNYNKFMLIE